MVEHQNKSNVSKEKLLKLLSKSGVLQKTLDAGVLPDRNLVGGPSLQMEDLSPVMHNLCMSESQIKLQKFIETIPTKSTVVFFNRQLSYGSFGSSARREGAVGDYSIGEYIRASVPMCYYATAVRVTVAASKVEPFDGLNNVDREAENAAKRIAMDIEFDSFRGNADFSNGGVFDGNPVALPSLPNMHGMDVQIRQADAILSAQDLMLSSYGGNQSVVLSKNGSLDQAIIEDAHVRSLMNHGSADTLFADPQAISAYNKTVALGSGVNSIQRIVLANGSPIEASGADLRRQYVSQGEVVLESHRLLSGKTGPSRPEIGSPSAAPTLVSVTATGSNGIIPAGSYRYLVTAQNDRGESVGTLSAAVTVAAGNRVEIVIAPQGDALFYNVYRASGATSTAGQARFIGRVKAELNANTLFVDLGNKLPGFSTAFLVQKDAWEYRELSPYSRLQLATVDLTVREAHFRFVTLVGTKPRMNVIIDNII